jgi:hypothetical protein
MKLLLLSSILAFAALNVSAADTPSFSGQWKIHSSIAGTESDSACTLTQKDNELTGTCTTDQSGQKATGKVDGLKAEWSYPSEYNGTALIIKYTGTLDPAASKISGSVNVSPFDVDGDFSATLDK